VPIETNSESEFAQKKRIKEINGGKKGGKVFRPMAGKKHGRAKRTNGKGSEKCTRLGQKTHALIKPRKQRQRCPSPEKRVEVIRMGGNNEKKKKIRGKRTGERGRNHKKKEKKERGGGFS